ncbi:cation:proton antiporter [Planctomonas deserti]|uniref:cation:proton antiporter n=1 Tax=Planctomonas deserti TaxID=2144185 RepID=UPI000D33BEB8|nr:cation:proton antiporter [Planctomonas deserti]
MHLGEDLIILGLLFVIAYVLGRLGTLIGLPAIPVYMVVGLLASPNTHVFPLNFDSADVELIAVFGLVLLLFSLGLEFDQDAFFTSAGRLLLSGGSYILLNTGAGLLFGILIGWGPREALIIAGMIGTSSSAIITKLLIELRRLANTETPVVLGVTVVGDIFIAVYLAIVSVVLSGETEAWPIVMQLTIAFLFLIVMFAVARWGGRVVTRLTRTRDEELFTILFFGLAVMFAGIGELIGVTDAIGAFLIGLVLGATRHRARIERASVPLRDVFAAFFFVNFGLALDVAEFGSVVTLVLAAVLLTFAVNILSGFVIARLHSLTVPQAINTAAIMVNRGEFTLILATLSLGAGLDERLQPFAGLYVLLMAVLGPLFASNSERIGQAVAGRRRPVTHVRPPRDLERENAIALMEAATADMTEDTREPDDGEGDLDRRTIRSEPRTRPEREREPDY